MKDATHIRLPAALKKAARIRAIELGKTLTRYITDLVQEDVEAPRADGLAVADVKEDGHE